MPGRRTVDAVEHGTMTRAGDEFNHDPFYFCAKCARAHGRALPECDGLRGGYAPPVTALGAQLSSVDQAVDQWVEMERKAAAWDQLRLHLELVASTAISPENLLDWLDELLPPPEKGSRD